MDNTSAASSICEETKEEATMNPQEAFDHWYNQHPNLPVIVRTTMRYSLWLAQNKRIVRPMGDREGWAVAVDEAKWIIEAGDSDPIEEVYITPLNRREDVLAVVDKEGIRVQ